jgi:hypothetical protein
MVVPPVLDVVLPPPQAVIMAMLAASRVGRNSKLVFMLKSPKHLKILVLLAGIDAFHNTGCEKPGQNR